MDKGFKVFQLLLQKAGENGKNQLQEVNSFRAVLKRDEIRRRNEATKARREGHHQRAARLQRERKQAGGFTKQEKSELAAELLARGE